MKPWELREARRASGLTLRQVARAAGTSESNVSAYERGSKAPNADTIVRLNSVIAVGKDSALHSRKLMSAPVAAALIRTGLRSGWSTADMLRIVREMCTHFEDVVLDQEIAAFVVRPSTTGDRRWDAMLAGTVEMLMLRRDNPVPSWTAGGALPEFWFVGGGDALRAYAFAHSPFSLQIRGVMLDPQDLVAV